MSDISFNEVPIDIFRPGIYIEIDPSLSKTGLPVFRQRTVMFGQIGTDATATPGQLTPIITAADGVARFGVDSMLASMVERFRDVNPFQDLLVVPLAENPAGVAATGTLTIGGAATQSSTQVFYIADRRYQLGVAATEDGPSVAGRLATLVNNDPTSYVTATNVGGVLTFTCKWKGETGNGIAIMARYYADDYPTPGLTFDIVDMANGAGNPDITAAIDALDDLIQYQGYISPYTDTANMNVLRAELDTRFGPLSALDGRVFTAFRGGVAAASAYAVARNSQHQAVIDTTEAALSPPWDWAASLAGDVMFYGATDPGRPFQTLELKGILGAPVGTRRLNVELETLLRTGVSTHLIGDDGKARIERVVTTYSKNAAGAEDQAYKSMNTVMLMSFYRRSVINRFKLKFPRHKLGERGHPAAGLSSNLVTPETVEAEFLAHYRLMVENGLMDDFDGYKEDLLAEKNSNVRGRVDVFDRPRPIDQFHQLAVRAAFKLI